MAGIFLPKVARPFRRLVQTWRPFFPEILYSVFEWIRIIEKTDVFYYVYYFYDKDLCWQNTCVRRATDVFTSLQLDRVKPRFRSLV